MLIYSESNPNFSKYGTLERGDLVIHILVGDTSEELFLEGVKPSCSVQELQDVIQEQIGIHHSRQRLFIGGEEMSRSGALFDYFSLTSHAANDMCTLSLRCFVPLLLSTLHCPGPMLAEIEVRARNDEPIIAVKRRIRDKFHVEVSKQRLHVHPSEMTSYFLRKPLDDDRLLSAYLSPTAGGNFLELIVVTKFEQTSINENEKELYVRNLRAVCNTSKFVKTNILKFSQELQGFSSPIKSTNDKVYSKSILNADKTPPPPPPQTPESDISKDEKSSIQGANCLASQLEPWWITIPIQIDQVIKRDPKVEDVLKILKKSLLERKIYPLDPKTTEESTVKKVKNFALQLKFCDVKLGRGGKLLDEKQRIYKDLLMRREDMLVYLLQQGVSNNNLNLIPQTFFGNKEQILQYHRTAVPPMTPILPLENFRNDQVLFTCPPDPIRMQWNIDSSDPIDKGAHPKLDLELTGLSYSRRYGSWDIPEHQKTYVEIIVEGTSSVGDLGYSEMIKCNAFRGFENLDHNGGMLKSRTSGLTNVDKLANKKTVYYVLDAIEITISGPLNPSFYKPRKLSQSKPFGSSAKEFVAERKKLFEFHQEIRRGELKNPPMPRPAPFYMRINEKHVEKTSPLSNEISPSWKDRRQLSKNDFDQWCVSRERITDIGVSNEVTPSLKAFSTHCTRGKSKNERPFVKVFYERRFPIQSTENVIMPRKQHIDSVRTSFDFRIQVQFQISQLVEDLDNLEGTADFNINARQWITRIEHSMHVPNSCSQFTSPSSEMNETIKVGLATEKWIKTTQKQTPQTIELQKMTN